jgi:hypothetical protein
MPQPGTLRGMSLLRWWVGTVPEWGWREIAREGHSFAGLAVFGVCAVVYAAVNLAVLGAVVAGVAAMGRRLRVSGG